MNEPIQDKAPKPPGLLPKHVQSWLILGLAVLMVVIMWLTSPKKAQTPAKSNTSVAQTPAPLQINETQIAELQSRIEELQRQEVVAQNALAQQTRLLGGAPTSSQPNQVSEGSANGPNERSEDPIQAERKKRAYLSLFASNIALSYRKNAAVSEADAPAPEPQSPSSANPAPPPAGLDATQIAQLLKDMQPPATAQLPAASQQGVAPSVPARGSSSASPTEADHDTKEVTRPAATSPGVPNVAAGKTYIVFEGTILEAVLINRLDGSFAGPVECLLSDDIYSHDRQHLLIPSGTKILGEAKKVEALGQTRTGRGSGDAPHPDRQEREARERSVLKPEREDSPRAYYVRDREYLLRESEVHTLSELGRFCVVAPSDLAKYGYSGDSARMERDIKRLKQQSLLSEKTLEISGKKTLRVITLTKQGAKLLRKTNRLPDEQEIYHGLVKPREAKHDADLYRLYQKEASRIERAGGKSLRVILDYELKRDLYRDLVALGPQKDDPDAKELVAEKHHLHAVNGKIPLPDVRIEYENAQGELSRVDLELATRHYRPRGLAAKAKAGFSIYSHPEEASRLRRILNDQDLTSGLLTL